MPKVAPGMGPRMAGNPYTEVAESPMDVVACRRLRFVANAATEGLMRREIVRTVRSLLVQGRLTFLLHRFTLVAVSAMLILVSAAAFFLAYRLGAVAVTVECLNAWPRVGPGAPSAACQASASEFRSIDGAWAAPLLGAMGGVGPLAGLLAGAALVAREIEDGTAAVAWSLSPSRMRWLVGRVAPVAVLLLVLSAIASVAATELAGARYPGLDPSLSFYNGSSHGLTPVAAGMVVFAAAVFAGSLLSRVLPALIVGSVLGLFLVGGVFFSENVWFPGQTIVVDARVGNDYRGAYGLDTVVQLSSGEFKPQMDFSVDFDSQGNVIGLPAGAALVDRLIPGTRHPFVDAVEAAAMGAMAVCLLAATAFVVRRRRPY
jgi:ABC-type transport system involved in multi-copper enzyme maturation permease subunit